MVVGMPGTVRMPIGVSINVCMVVTVVLAAIKIMTVAIGSGVADGDGHG